MFYKKFNNITHFGKGFLLQNFYYAVGNRYGAYTGTHKISYRKLVTHMIVRGLLMYAHYFNDLHLENGMVDGALNYQPNSPFLTPNP